MPKLDVILTPGEGGAADVAGRTVVVIDALRATSTIVEALASGAKTIYPVASIEEALRLANTLGRDEVLLCGERKALPIEGFDLGNSPREMTPEKVGGKTLVMSTTNGTVAMTAAAAAARVLVGAWINLTAVVDELVRQNASPVFFCAGREGRFGVEDAACAGAMARAFMDAVPEGEWELNDGALAALSLAAQFADPADLFPKTAAGRQIEEAGLGEDLAFCAQTDLRDIVPVLHDRQITLAPSPSGAAAAEA